MSNIEIYFGQHYCKTDIKCFCIMVNCKKVSLWKNVILVRSRPNFSKKHMHLNSNLIFRYLLRIFFATFIAFFLDTTALEVDPTDSVALVSPVSLCMT